MKYVALQSCIICLNLDSPRTWTCVGLHILSARFNSLLLAGFNLLLNPEDETQDRPCCKLVNKDRTDVPPRPFKHQLRRTLLSPFIYHWIQRKEKLEMFPLCLPSSNWFQDTSAGTRTACRRLAESSAKKRTHVFMKIHLHTHLNTLEYQHVQIKTYIIQKLHLWSQYWGQDEWLNALLYYEEKKTPHIWILMHSITLT